MRIKKPSRYEVLDATLTIFEGLKRFYSRNQSSVEAAQGFEDQWERMSLYVEVIQDMMKEVRYGEKGK